MDLKSARKQIGLTQADLGLTIGISSQQISNIELGRNFPDERTRQKIEVAVCQSINFYQSYYKRKGIDYEHLFAMLDCFFELSESNKKIIYDYARKYTMAKRLDVRNYID